METETAPQQQRTQGSPASAGGTTVTTETKTRRRPPVALLLLSAIAVIAILIWGIRYLAYATTHESTDDARVDADTVAITPKIQERVREVLVDANQPVRKGQVVIRLDDTDELTQLRQAIANRDAQRAQANAAQQNVDLTRAQVQAQNAQGAGGVSSGAAAIANAQAQAVSAREQATAQQSAIVQAQAQLRAAQAQVPAAAQALARANADLARTQALVRTGDIAQQQLDAARAVQAQAQSQYQAARDNVAAAQTGVAQAQARYTSSVASANAAQAGIAAQQGQLATAQGRLAESNNPYRVSATEAQAQAADAQANALNAQVFAAQNRVGYTTVRSPIDGVVGAKNVEIGTVVQPGQTLLAIVPNRGVYVTANFKETQLGKMRAGQPVDIKVDAYKGTTFRGHVQTIAPASQNTFSLVPAQNATGNFVKVTQRLPVRIVFDNPPADKPLRVGMSVEASVKVK